MRLGLNHEPTSPRRRDADVDGPPHAPPDPASPHPEAPDLSYWLDERTFRLPPIEPRIPEVERAPAEAADVTGEPADRQGDPRDALEARRAMRRRRARLRRLGSGMAILAIASALALLAVAVLVPDGQGATTAEPVASPAPMIVAGVADPAPEPARDEGPSLPPLETAGVVVMEAQPPAAAPAAPSDEAPASAPPPAVQPAPVVEPPPAEAASPPAAPAEPRSGTVGSRAAQVPRRRPEQNPRTASARVPPAPADDMGWEPNEPPRLPREPTVADGHGAPRAAPRAPAPRTIRVLPWTSGCRVRLVRYHLGLRLDRDDWAYLRRVCEMR